MAAHIPEKLKAADLTRFIVRATQLEHVKPVIAYWCEYWIVNQILSKGLHEKDAETLQYTTSLMDKLEQIKSENATNDAIVDDTAGQAYVEHFGLETFFRADRVVKASKVTKQTADTFQAAATFLELINIWATPDTEIQAKIKYAKWNAVRIVKALKEGKDPNESNPKTEPEPEPGENLPTLDPNDPEVQAFHTPTNAQQPSVEDVPDEQDRVEARLARQSSIDQSLHPSAQVSAQVSARGSPAPPFEPYPKDGFPYTAVQDDNVSPLEPSPTGRNGSVGGGYFPEVPTFTEESKDVIPATAPNHDMLDLSLPQQPFASLGTKTVNDFQSFPPPAIPDEPPQDYYRQSPPPSVPPPQQPPNQFDPQSPYPSSPPVQETPSYLHPPPPIQQTSTYSQPPPQQPPSFYHPQSQQPQYQPPSQQPPTYATPHAFQQRSHQPGGPPPSAAAKQQLITDDMAIAKAQKHARWAISALNFEDAETAVKELREALKTLGAS